MTGCRLAPVWTAVSTASWWRSTPRLALQLAVGMLMSAAMIWHRQLRHFILLPSCVALIGGIMLMIVSRLLL
ncbi:DUF1435 family protein, partial [Klebsiella pneumoniae]|uniref:DUF1435 family protein n=1 Tax=Klebsiella pneumoniae TaxID=573 RepID=UPI0021097A69